MDSTRKRYWIFMALGLVLLAVMLLPKRLEQRACDQFAEPLYAHALPEGSRLVQKSAVKGDSGDFTAALILATELNGADLKAFFEDTEYPPAKKGQTVTLDVKPLDDGSLDALQQAGMLKAGETYWFVYIYSV